MITMQAADSRERCLTRKCLPCMTGFALVAGTFMMVAGIVVFTGEQTHAAISSLSIQNAPIFLLIAGILSLFAGFVGIYFSCKKFSLSEMWILIAFIVLLALAAILALVAGGLGVDNSNKLKSGFEMDLKKKLEMYGKTGRYETLVNVDRLQKEDKCCGVINYVDWRNTTYAGRRYDKVPDSCCIEEKHACGFGFKIEKIKHKGCSAVAMKKMNTDFKFVGIGGIVIGIIEIIWCLVFCSCWLYEVKCASTHEARVRFTYTKSTSAREGEVASTMEDPTGAVGSDNTGAQGGDQARAQEGDKVGAQGGDAPTERKSSSPKPVTHRGKSKTAPET